MDNLIKQIQHRPTEADQRNVALKALYSDKNFVTLQGGIQDRNVEWDLPGLITDPGLCVAGMTISYAAFVCLAPGGVLCQIPSGMAGLSPSDPSIARIDIMTVDPLVQYDADGEIEYSGIVEPLAGFTPYGFPVMPNCPLTSLKIGELDVAAGTSNVVLRDWRANYVVPSMVKPWARTIPGLCINVNPYRGFVAGQTLTNFVGATVSFTPPGNSGVHRIDLLTLIPGLSPSLHVTAGLSVAAPTIPSAPSIPHGELPIAEVHLYGEQDYITQADIKDIRPFASWKESEAAGDKVWSTLSFAYVSSLTIMSNFAPALVPGCTLEIDRGYGYVKTPPVGGCITVDILVNNVSIFAGITPNMIQILSGQNADESGIPTTTTISKNQVVTVDVLTIASGLTPGSDLTAHLRCKQTLTT